MENPQHKMINGYKHIAYHYVTPNQEELIKKSESFYHDLDRKSVV